MTRAAARALIPLGGLCLLLGSVGVQEKDYLGQEIPFIISGAIGAAFLFGTGAVLWISAGLRERRQRLSEIDTSLRAVESALRHRRLGGSRRETLL